jgi:hypothetical protein
LSDCHDYVGTKLFCKTDFVGYVDEMSLWGDGAEGWLEPRTNCTEVQAAFRDVAPDTVAAAEDVLTKKNAPGPQGIE